MTEPRPNLVPAESIEKADLLVTPSMGMGRYLPQLAAELYHDRHGHWPWVRKWAVGQKNPLARNMFAHNYWQNLMAAQRSEQPLLVGRSRADAIDAVRTRAARRGLASYQRLGQY
jgi:hypothetical protein